MTSNLSGRSVTKSWAAALLVSATSLAAFATLPVQADDLIVKYDQSRLLQLSKPAAEIIIGNPAIADISVQGGNLLVVTGTLQHHDNVIHVVAKRLHNRSHWLASLPRRSRDYR